MEKMSSLNSLWPITHSLLLSHLHNYFSKWLNLGHVWPFTLPCHRGLTLLLLGQRQRGQRYVRHRAEEKDEQAKDNKEKDEKDKQEENKDELNKDEEYKDW